MNLVLVDRRDLDDQGRVTLVDVRARHLSTVLRVACGQTVRLGVLDGPLGSGVVTAMTDAAVTLQCAFEATVPAVPAVDLLLALPRPKVLHRLWAQLAALGVGRIMLTNAERVERNYFDTHVLAESIYRPLLVEGLQQARDTRVPVVTVHRRFRVLVEDELPPLLHAPIRIVAHPSTKVSLRDVFALPSHVPLREARSRVLLAVGPEGGWKQFELDLLDARGFVPVAMGPRTLRTDTACIALIALVHEALSAVQAKGRHLSAPAPREQTVLDD